MDLLKKIALAGTCAIGLIQVASCTRVENPNDYLDIKGIVKYEEIRGENFESPSTYFLVLTTEKGDRVFMSHGEERNSKEIDSLFKVGDTVTIRAFNHQAGSKENKGLLKTTSGKIFTYFTMNAASVVNINGKERRAWSYVDSYYNLRLRR